MNSVDGTALVAAIERAAVRLVENRDRLNELDAAMGDSDTGITVSKAAASLHDYLADNSPGDNIGRFLMGAGSAINRAAPSTLGTLLATALMRAGKECQGLANLDGDVLARMLIAADLAVQERGRAKPGDKTIVDALHPAAESFARSVLEGHELRPAAKAMLDAARAGRDAVVPLRSKIGRAAWVGERTENHADPGTVVFVTILEAILSVDADE